MESHYSRGDNYIRNDRTTYIQRQYRLWNDVKVIALGKLRMMKENSYMNFLK